MLTKHTFPLLLAACLFQGALALPAAEAASAGSSSGALDVNFFYDNLKNDGSWFNTTEYGDVWQPYIAYKSDSWRPYTDGYWSYTDGGWMFVSYEDFGWAVYHYGRWTQLKDIGWAWVPGTEWAPAWVTWRESKPAGTDATPPPGDNAPPAANVAATTTDANNEQGTPPAPPSDQSNAGGSPGNNAAGSVPPGASQNYVGWAPLPPDPGPAAYNEGYGYGPSVDVDYGIDPYDYTYTDVRFFGAPFLGAVIFDPGLNYYYGDRSVNISDFRYNDRGGYRGFYDGGPRYDQFRGVGERPIPQYNIRREQGRLAQQSVRTNRFNQINGKNINVVAPRFSQTNVRNGRMNFTHQGTLPVTQVGRVHPASEVNNAARERAQNTFRQQGEAFRSQHPDAPGVRRTAPGGVTGQPGSRIATTPRAQQEERAARQEAQQEGPARNPGANPNAAEADRAAGQPENRPGEAANQPPREGERTNGHEDRATKAAQNRAGSADHAARREAHTTNTVARRSSGGRRSRGESGGIAVRQSRGGGGGRRGGGDGGGQTRGGGGGGHQGGGGGDGGHKGGGDGGKKH